MKLNKDVFDRSSYRGFPHTQLKFLLLGILRFLSFIGVPKLMVGRLYFWLTITNGLLLQFFKCRVNERTVEYLWILRNLDKNKKKVLDIGCSGSFLSYELIARGYDTYGVDIGEYNERPLEMKFYLSDIRSLPFENDFFDQIILVSTLEHIGIGAFSDPQYENGDLIALKEIKRVLTPTGKVFITVPYAEKSSITWHRFYDNQRLQKFTENGLVILKEEYFRCIKNRWTKYTKEDFSKGKFTLEKNKVACIVCLILAQKENK